MDFRQPLKLWQVLVCFLAASVVGNLIVVVLREGLHITYIPQWVGGGLGGVLGVTSVLVWANLARR